MIRENITPEGPDTESVVVSRNYRGMLYVYYCCEGCGHHHSVPAEQFKWNGSFSHPTLSPDVRHFVEAQDNGKKTICRYFVRNGVIQYSDESRHKLAGQHVALKQTTPRAVFPHFYDGVLYETDDPQEGDPQEESDDPQEDSDELPEHWSRG